MSDRTSDAEIPPLISDPIKLAELETRNSLEQYDYAIEEVERWLTVGKPKLRVSTLLTLHRYALKDTHQYAGNFRPASVAIRGSRHEPISADDVPRYVEEMLDYLEENWDNKSEIHLSSYAMWRLNWIHPFADGNGRTSRMFSYMILCAKLGYVLPGTNTIPEQISQNKKPYYLALEEADENIKNGKIDLTGMESIIERYLNIQLDTKNKKKKSKTKVFISYNHKDEKHLKRLHIHLKPLEKASKIDIWDDTKIKTGDKWEEKIMKALSDSVIAVLIISADFLASDYIIDNELPPLLEKANREGTKILPVILSTCRFERDNNLSKFQSLNPPNKPILTMSDNEKEAIWDKLAREIEDFLNPSSKI